MNILVAMSGEPFQHGWEGDVASGLVQALARAGHAAELVMLPFSGSPPAQVLDQMLACRLLDFTEAAGFRIDRLIALNFPAYLIPHPHKAIWLLKYPLWDFQDYPDGTIVQDALNRANRDLGREAKGLYAISESVARRIGMPARILPAPPAGAELWHGSPAEDYFLSSGAPPETVLQSLARCRQRTVVQFASTAGEQALEMARALRLEDRVQWRGEISAAERRELYARCLGVIVADADETGYQALEGMLCEKPVLFASDAAAMDNLWADRGCAQALGKAARTRYDQLKISWDRVLETLLA